MNPTPSIASAIALLPPLPLPNEQPLESATDARLVASIVAGDQQAFGLLYQRHRAAAFALAYSMLRDASTAEDLVHDAFLRAWSSAATYQPQRGSLRSWLLTIVRNAVIDYLRSRALATRPDMARAQLCLSTPASEDVHATAALTIDAERLRRALTTLPDEQRQAVELAFLAGMTHGDIATRTGVPLGTVKGRVRLGLRRLRETMSGPEVDFHSPTEKSLAA